MPAARGGTARVKTGVGGGWKPLVVAKTGVEGGWKPSVAVTLRVVEIGAESVENSVDVVTSKPSEFGMKSATASEPAVQEMCVASF